MALPGVVYSLRFVQAADAKDNYSSFAVGYLNRPQAFEKNEHEDDALYHDRNPRYDQFSYMDNKDKTDGLFDAAHDLVSDYGKYLYKQQFDASQKKDCPLYQGVISFDNDFLRRNHIDYTSEEGLAHLKEIARGGIAALIQESHLREDNVVWTAAIHTNTDNIHIHMAIVEKEKVDRQYDRIEQKAFEKLKSRVANAIVKNEETEELSQVFHMDLPHAIRGIVQTTGEEIDGLLHILPASVPWQYNRDGMAPYRSAINDAIDRIITSHTTLTAQFQRGLGALQRYEDFVREVYGTGKLDRPKEASENKLKEFYVRAGNALLDEAKKVRELRADDTADRGRLAGEKNEGRPSGLPDAGKKSEEPEPLPEENGRGFVDGNFAGASTPSGLAGGKNEESAYTENGVPLPDESEMPEPPSPDWDGSMNFGYAPDASGLDTGYELPGEVTQPAGGAGLAGEENENLVEHLITDAKAGKGYAMFRLGKLLEQGELVEQDHALALGLFVDAAEKGNPYAAYRAARMYRDGIGTPPDEFRESQYFYVARKGFEELAEEKPELKDRCLYRLGMMALHGESFPVDLPAAASYFEDAAYYGNHQAEYQLGLLYLRGGEGLDRNVEKAVEYLRRAVVSGDPKASYVLGKMLMEGKDIPKDELFARSLLTVAADSGNHKAEYLLGKLFRDGKYKNAEQANRYFNSAFEGERRPAEQGEYYVEWTDEYKEARNYLYALNGVGRDYETGGRMLQAQADAGNVLAIYDLARLYVGGLGRDANPDQANAIYAKSLDGFLFVERQSAPPNSKSGFDPKPYIQYRVGKMYAQGLGTDQDYSAAASWYGKSADAGNKFAQYALAGLYYHGRGVEKDLLEAYRLYSLSAEQNNAFAAWEAGKMARDGVGVKQDAGAADTYFRQAYTGFSALEEQTHDDKIQYRLGKMLETGTGTTKDLAAAIKLYESSSEMGNANAQYALAKIWLSAGDPQSVERAFGLLEKSAEGKNPFAQYALGCLYLEGKSVAKDIPKACELLTASSLQDNDFAQYKLGCLYLDGNLIAPDLENGLQLLTASAELGNQYAQYRLGCIYLSGEGLGRDPDQALELLRASTGQGNAYAAYRLGRLYGEGKEVPKEPARAEEYLKAAFSGFRAMEDEKPDAQTEYRLGSMLLRGEGCEIDAGNAAAYFEKSAAGGNQYAQYTLGTMYLTGKGVDKSVPMACELLKASAAQGEAAAAYRLGRIYGDGTEIRADPALSAQYFADAFHGFLADESERPDSQTEYRLGTMQLHGEGCAPDHTRAAGWLEKSANGGNQYAQYTLGSMCLAGDGVGKDVKKACKLLARSAGQGNAYAAYRVGRLYSDGEEFPRDGERAVYYFGIAYKGFLAMEAETPDSETEYRLGSMLQRGEGCQKDSTRASALFEQSARKGNPYAQCAFGSQCLSEGKREAALQWFKEAAAQGNAYAAQAVDRLTHPHVAVQRQKTYHSLRAALSISRSVQRFGREYERRIESLKDEFQYEQDQEMLEHSRSR